MTPGRSWFNLKSKVEVKVGGVSVGVGARLAGIVRWELDAVIRADEIGLPVGSTADVVACEAEPVARFTVSFVGVLLWLPTGVLSCKYCICAALFRSGMASWLFVYGNEFPCAKVTFSKMSQVPTHRRVWSTHILKGFQVDSRRQVSEAPAERQKLPVGVVTHLTRLNSRSQTPCPKRWPRFSNLVSGRKSGLGE